MTAFLQTMLFTISGILLLCSAFLFSHCCLLYRRQRDYLLLQSRVREATALNTYYQTLLQQEENKSILIHDIRKHLQSLYVLNISRNHEQIAAYLDHLLCAGGLQPSVRSCDLDLLNALVLSFRRRCAGLQIAFHTDIRSDCISFLSDTDITSLFSNLLENALEGAQDSPKAFIEVTVRPTENAGALISVINACACDPFAGNPLLHSRKKTGMHGIGLKSVRQVAGKYDGNLTLYYDQKAFRFHAIVRLKSAKKIASPTT